MAAPYSLDVRVRVVAAVGAGMSRAEAAARHNVSYSTVIRWTRRNEETGSPAALPMGGKKPFALADHEAWIRQHIAEKPDLTYRELRDALTRRGVKVSYYAVWHFLDYAGLNLKKMRSARADRPVPVAPADEPGREGGQDANASSRGATDLRQQAFSGGNQRLYA